MKKILSILVTLCLICSLTVTCFADTVTSVNDEIIVEVKGAQAAEFLRAIGVIDKKAEYTLSDAMTRGEFAKLVCVAAGYPVLDTYAQRFSDVSPEHEYAPYINTLAQAGVVGGYADGTYSPDREIMTGEAVSVLTIVLGYGAYAQSKGGYPAGYYYTANRLDMFDYLEDINMAETASKGEIAQLCFNALNTLTLNQISYGEEPRFGSEDGMTLLYQSMGIVHITDIVNSVDISSLRGENLTPGWHIVVGNTKLEVGELDTTTWNFLGYEVDAYYKEARTGAEDTLVYIAKTSENRETVISISDIYKVENGKIYYWDETGKEDVSYNIVSSVIWNGASTGEAFSYEALRNYEGRVTVVSNDGDKSGDVIYVEAYQDYVVGAVDVSGEKIYDAYDNTKSISVDVDADDPYTIVYLPSGEEGSINDINTNDVISVYKSNEDADQRLYKLYKTNSSVTGKITSLSTVNDRICVETEEGQYLLTKTASSNLEKAFGTNSFKVGDNVQLSLNVFGEIADVRVVSDMTFGFLIGADEGSGLKSNIQFKIYSENAEFIIANSAEKYTVDNVRYSRTDSGVISKLKASSALIYTADDGCIAQPVRYRLNSNGEIIFLDTIFNDIKNEIEATRQDAVGDNALFRGHSGTDLRYRMGGMLFGQNGAGGNTKFIINANTKVIRYTAPSIGNKDYFDEDRYKVHLHNGITGGEDYTYDAASYYYEKDSITAPYVMLNADTESKVSDETRLSVISAISRCLYNETECTKLTVVGQGGRKSIYIKDDFRFTLASVADTIDAEGNPLEDLSGELSANNLKIGDVIRYTTDYEGYLEGVWIYYRIPEKRLIIDTGMQFNLAFYVSYAYPMQKGNDGLNVIYTRDKSQIASADTSQYIAVPNYSSCTYILYDSKAVEGKKVKVGSYTDILPYETVGEEDTSLVIIQASVGTPYVIIVVK